MVQRRRRDEQIGLRERVSCLPAVLDEEAPLEQHVLTDVEHPLSEQRPDLMGEPCVQLGPAVRIGHRFDAETNLGERDRADVEEIKWLFGDKCDDAAMWPSPAELRED